MSKRALSAVAGFSGICLTFSAWAQPETLMSLNSSIPHLSSLALRESGTVSFSSGFGWMERAQPEFLPALEPASATSPRRASVTSANLSTQDSSKEEVELRRPSFFEHASGEVGFLYGRSSGKHGVSTEQGYIIGEVGDEKFHITVGASHEESSGRLPRFVR